MRQGMRTIKRVHARNFVQESSQKRLDESVVPFNHQVLNSLDVDYVPIYYYSSLHTGLPCSCEQQDTLTEFDSSAPDNTEIIRDSQTSTSHDIIIGLEGNNSYTDPNIVEVIDQSSYYSMFGDAGANDDSDDDYDLNIEGPDPYAPIEPEIEMYNSDSALFGGRNINCGLCYRTGFIPSHSLERGMRLVLTHHNIVDAVGYFVNKAQFPYRFERLDEQGYIQFNFMVPKYFANATFTIRNNLDILHDKLYYGAQIVDINLLRQLAGKSIVVNVKAKSFTHVSITFHQNIEMMRINIPNISRQLDYTMLETVSNLQAIIPPYVGACVAGDLIAAPTRNLYMKVVSVTYAQTSKMRRLEWQADCRVLQPQEALRKLFFERPF